MPWECLNCEASSPDTERVCAVCGDPRSSRAEADRPLKKRKLRDPSKRKTTRESAAVIDTAKTLPIDIFPDKLEEKPGAVVIDTAKTLPKVALVLSAVLGCVASAVLAAYEVYVSDILPPEIMEEVGFWTPIVCLILLTFVGGWVGWKIEVAGSAFWGTVLGLILGLVIIEFLSIYLPLPVVAIILTGVSIPLLWRHSINSLTHDGINGKTQALIVGKMLVPPIIFFGFALSSAFVDSNPPTATGKNPPSHFLGFSQPGSKGRMSGGSSKTGNASKPRTTPPSPATVEMRLRLRLAERKLVQRGLAALKHEPGQADGQFGRKTRSALERWQRSKGYAATGYLNRGQANELIAIGRNARLPYTSSSPTPSYPPGKYQLVKDAPLLKEPHDTATVITKLSLRDQGQYHRKSR